MRKYLLPKDGRDYKANLHTHTTVSDGHLTPEEIKQAYMEKGYSIVAYTDHEILVPHTELTDENFLALTAAEVAINLYHTSPAFSFVKAYHLNLYAKQADKNVLPVFDKDYTGFFQNLAISSEQEKRNFKREYTKQSVNETIARANADGFLVSYNHPVWSLQNYADYEYLDGLWGIECFNTDAARVGLPDTERPFHDLLMQGKAVYPLATDDMHVKEDLFGGFVMVKAESLHYDTIMQALENGDFYASTAPLIHEFSIENGVLRVRCSPVKEIRVNTERRHAWSVRRSGETPLTETEIDIGVYLWQTEQEDKWKKPFIRLTLVDEQGNYAYTRAYFLEEIIG